MAKKKKIKKRGDWEIKEELSGEKRFRRDWDRQRSWGGFGFGVFLVIIAIIWMARDFGWIPSIPLWPVIVLLFGLFIALTSLAKR